MNSASSGDKDAVTVVIPTHNRAHVIGQTVESVLRQNDVSVVVVVVDDASTDETQAVLAKYPMVKVICHPRPTEQRTARNDGAASACTPWIAFCDDDDLWAPTKLRRQLDAARSHGADWCTCGAIYVDETLSPIGGQRLRDSADIPRLITRQNVVPAGGSGVLMRTALFRQVGGFREDARYVEDWDLWIRLSQHGTVVCLDELLVAQRKWPCSYSRREFDRQRRAFYDVVQRYTGSPRKPLQMGPFEVRRRLVGEPRISVLRHLPRILRESPEDWLPVLALIAIPDPILRRLRLRSLGADEVEQAVEWLSPYRATVGSVAGLSQVR